MFRAPSSCAALSMSTQIAGTPSAATAAIASGAAVPRRDSPRLKSVQVAPASRVWNRPSRSVTARKRSPPSPMPTRSTIRVLGSSVGSSAVDHPEAPSLRTRWRERFSTSPAISSHTVVTTVAASGPGPATLQRVWVSSSANSSRSASSAASDGSSSNGSPSDRATSSTVSKLRDQREISGESRPLRLASFQPGCPISSCQTS